MGNTRTRDMGNTRTRDMGNTRTRDMGNTRTRDMGNTFGICHKVTICDNDAFHNQEKGNHPCHGMQKSLWRKSERNS